MVLKEAIAKLSSQPPSRRVAMASSLKLSVVTTLRFRSSPSLAAFWRLGGSFAITSKDINIAPFDMVASFTNVENPLVCEGQEVER
ncbi:MAG: hypothetical protein IKP00_06105 [Victivallales bacterium]|nr:hypothetical protein [Victivallales bacterium]